MKRSNLRIAIQKSGRLRKDSLKFLEKQGVKVPQSSKNSFIVPCENNLEILFVRYGDIPEYVASSVADFGIVGENLLYEENKKIALQSKLGFGHCRLVIAVPKGSKIKKIADLEGERIATSYPNSLRKFLRANGLGAAIVNIRGSVEAAPAIGLADAICDLTQTGETLKANDLNVIAEVVNSEAVLITPKEQSKKAEKFLKSLSEVNK
ncbi:MAG TPA: ATP phosphoribosyltransferase [Candidatus Saccharimonadales bacterium]|nr:ATP phosphoribosyltransferase [Candidatus Saccharimonadales bacterium]